MKKQVLGGFLKMFAGGVAVALGLAMTIGGGFDAGFAAGVEGTCRIIVKHIYNGEDMTLREFAEKYSVG